MAKVFRVRTYYRLTTDTAGKPWSSTETSYNQDSFYIDGPSPWSDTDVLLPGINAGGFVQNGQGSQTSTLKGNALAVLVAQTGHLGLKIGWQHSVMTDVDVNDEITNTAAYDDIINLNLTQSGDNTLLMPVGTTQPSGFDKILAQPSAILVDKRVIAPFITSNNKRRYQAGRSYVAYPWVQASGVAGTPPYVINTDGSIITNSLVGPKLNGTNTTAKAKGWPQVVVSAPQGQAPGDTLKYRVIGNYSIDAFVATQKRRLQRDNIGTVLVP
jgi:hypothetical protein